MIITQQTTHTYTHTHLYITHTHTSIKHTHTFIQHTHTSIQHTQTSISTHTQPPLGQWESTRLTFMHTPPYWEHYLNTHMRPYGDIIHTHTHTHTYTHTYTDLWGTLLIHTLMLPYG